MICITKPNDPSLLNYLTIAGSIPDTAMCEIDV